jgi:hypothetical protein
MRHAWVLGMAVACVAGAMVSACGDTTACDDALDKLTGECGLGSGALLGDLGECKDRTECFAKCVNKADCDDITNDKVDKYDTCMNDCYLEQF